MLYVEDETLVLKSEMETRISGLGLLAYMYICFAICSKFEAIR